MSETVAASASQDPVNLKLSLNDSHFCAGQIVTGTVTLNCKESILVSLLQVHLVGVSQALSFEYPRDIYDKYGLEIPRIRIRCYLSGIQSLISNEKLNPGQYHFDIEVALPEACPPSFESKDGKVEYKCIVEMLTLTMKDSNETKLSADQLFTVTGQSRDFLFAQPTSGSGQSGKSIITLKLNKGAYVPGDSIHCTIDATDGKLSISKVKTQLRQIITYTWVDIVYFSDRRENDLKNKTKERVIAEEKFKPNVGHKGLHLETTLELPSGCVSSFEASQSKNSVHPVTVEYVMMVKLYIGGLIPHKVKQSVPFLVGCNIVPQRGKEEAAPREYCEIPEGLEFAPRHGREHGMVEGLGIRSNKKKRKN